MKKNPWQIEYERTAAAYQDLARIWLRDTTYNEQALTDAITHLETVVAFLKNRLRESRKSKVKGIKR